jgi:hypothetical protein
MLHIQQWACQVQLLVGYGHIICQNVSLFINKHPELCCAYHCLLHKRFITPSTNRTLFYPTLLRDQAHPACNTPALTN